MQKLHLIPDPLHIRETLALTERYGARFEYNDFINPKMLDDCEETARRIAFYKALPRDRSEDTLHGAFLDITVHSDDPLIRDASMLRVRQSMDAAQKLGVKGVVFHTGLLSSFRVDYYTENWLKRNEEFWRQILKEYPEQMIYLENMFDEEPDRMLKLAELLKDEDRFGICLDYAHAQIFGEAPETWVEKLKPYIRHMHINDNDGQNDLHLSVGSGVTDWALYDKILKEAGISPDVLVETTDLERQEGSLKFMAEHRLYPFV